MTVAVIGVGAMGEAVVAGLVKAGGVDLVVADRSAARVSEISERHGVRASDPSNAVAQADVVVVVVKPHDVETLFAEVASVLKPGVLVVSLAAGLTTARLQGWLPEGTAVVRVMPNTPALVGVGMSVISGGTNASQAHLDQVSELLSGLGKTLVIGESYQDAVTAVSGSGPAYLFLVVESMVEAGVLLGLPRATATTLAVQTLLGSATLLAETGEHPTLLREQVTSPGGITAVALRVLEEHSIRAAFSEAMEAARDRSRDLAKG